MFQSKSKQPKRGSYWLKKLVHLFSLTDSGLSRLRSLARHSRARERNLISRSRDHKSARPLIRSSVRPHHRETNSRSNVTFFIASLGACNHVVADWQLSKQGIRWSVSHHHILRSSVDSLRLRFLKFSADKLLDLNSLLQAQLQVDFFTMVSSLLFKVNYINLLTQASS